MKKVTQIILWVAGVVVVILVGLTVVGFWHLGQVKKTDEAIQRINNRFLSLDDVMGKNLPPKPDQALNDSTIAGIDANNNGIRDDVELAIFEKYPNSAKIRAGMLQYAQALQLELTEVFNSETLVATIQKIDLAYGCLGKANHEEIDSYEKEVQNLALNTDIRKKAEDEVFKYMTTYSLLNSESCDINLSLLPN